MNKWHEYINNTYNYLTIISISYKIQGNRKRAFAECLCKCGVQKSIRLDRVMSGHDKSCGCKRHDPEFIEKTVKNLRKHKAWTFKTPKHGHSRRGKISKLYTAYNAIKTRCYKEDSESYHIYGGRGIRMCVGFYDKISGFNLFCKLLGEPPSK